MQQLRTQQHERQNLIEYTMDFKMNLLRAGFYLVLKRIWLISALNLTIQNLTGMQEAKQY